MSTSLAQQLRQLATPQTSLFKHTKKKVSVLFDPSEAASYDNQHIYDLALSGFVELKSINVRFTEFEDTLYDQSSISFERSIHNREENAIINKQVKKFLHILSPYFLLKASLKALEWLIRRYHINLYNVDDLVMLALPYHETRTFVRVIQVLNLSEENGRWHWLKTIQKPGVPLSKHALLNHCASSQSFLKLLCNTTIDAIKAHGTGSAQTLSTLTAFYCTTVIGALEQSGTKVTELQITHLLEALIKGYASRNIDFVAASYMITAQLVSKASLSTEVLDHLVLRILKKLGHPELLPDSILLLIVMYQNQHTLNNMSIKAVLQLGNVPNFPESIGEIAKSHRVTPLLVPIIKEALNIILHQDQSSTSMKMLIKQLLTEVKLDKEDADVVVRAVIDGYQSPDERMSDDVIDKDDIMKWYASLLQSLERAHPSVFDAAVCRTLKGEGISKERARDLKSMLGFELPLDLLDKLHHPVADIRAGAARNLSKKCATFTEKDLQALQGSLENLLLDNNPMVVSSALSFPSTVLVDVMGAENLRKALIDLLKRCVIAEDLQQWSSVVESVVRILSNLKIEDGPQEIETYLALLPLFDQDTVVKRVFSSRLKNQNLLNRILKISRKTSPGQNINSETVLPALVQCLSSESKLLNPEDVLEVVKIIKEQKTVDARWYVDRFYTALLLAASVPKGGDPSLGLKLLEENDNLLGSKQLVSSCEEVKLSTTSLAASLNVCRKRAVPIQCSFQLLSAVISRITTECQGLRPWFNLQDDSDQTKLLIEVYRKILTGCAHRNKSISSAYVSQMQLFLKQHCTTIEDRIAFLFSVSTFHEVSLKPEHLELSLRSLRLSKTFFSGSEEWSLHTDGDSNVVPALLLALQCSSPVVRLVACDVTEALTQSKNKKFHLKLFLQRVLAMKEELLLDEKQLQMVLYNILSPMSEFKLSKFQAHVLNSLLSCTLSERTPTYVTAGLLRALTAVNSEKILESLLPLVRRSLEFVNKLDEPNKPCSDILQNVLGRLDASTCGCLVKSDPWEAIVAAFKDQQTPILRLGSKIVRPAVVICEQIDGDLWEALSQLPGSLQEKLLRLLLASRSVAECPEVISAVSSAFKRVTLDSATAIPVLVRMKEVQVQEPLTARRTSLARTSIPRAPSSHILQTDEWRQGMALLELLQVKKKLNNVHLLIPILFDLLKRCLDFEEQAPVEYAKQVMLSCILLCCSKMQAEENQTAKTSTIKSVINVELVVQCIRASQNPQTHHHALLVLTHLADLVPEQVLHNIMAIFTFMGSLVLRQDDTYSFQVTSKILETIIPVLVKSSDDGYQNKLEETVTSVVRVFVDAMLDVPEHRRLGLYRKLLSTLDASRFLWVFLCLVFESHVVQPRTETSETKRKGAISLQSEVPKKLEVALQLVHEFSLETIFVNSVALLQYVRMLPVDLDDKTGKRPPVPPELAKYNIATLMNVEENSPKVLRHYKYTIVTFLSALLSSKPLVEKMTCTEGITLQSIEPVYHSFLASLLSYIQSLSHQVNTSKSPQSTKYWSVMLGQTCEILDKVNALLPSTMFITVISGLLVHNIQLLRRKALELLNARLSSAHSKQFMLTCDSESLLKLLKPLMDIVSSIENSPSEPMEEKIAVQGKAVNNIVPNDVTLTQQTAVYSLKVLTRLLAYDHRDTFTPILEKVTNLLKMRTLNSDLLATLILCCAELCSALKAHAIVALPSLVPRMIELLSEHSSNLSEAPHLVLLTVVSALLRVVDTLPNFLSQYLKELLEEMTTLLAQCSMKVSDEGEGCKFVPVVNKLTLAGQKMSTSIAPRVLVPAVSQCYEVLKSKAQIGVGPLMTILSDSFAGLNPADLRNLLSDLTEFFLNALNYRHECASRSADKDAMAQVAFVEGHVIRAWISLVLKLSETSFKPLYYKLYDWATRLDSHKDRVITFYRLSYSVSDCLKGLFPSYSGYFLKNAAMLLDYCNATKVGESDETEFNDQDGDRLAELYFGSGEIAEKKCASLVEHILNTLKNVFLYDSQDFVNKETFEGLVRPLIDQLENTVDGMHSLKSRAENILIPCIAQFAVALDDDIVWKHINYQILLKTKHKNPQIRLISLEAVCKVVHKLGDSFLPLIPETMPFLAELLEDEDEHVEKACRHAVQDLEQVLGEPLQKYF